MIKLKMKLAVVFLSTILLQVPALSQQVVVQDECYRNVEEYVPGYTTPGGSYVPGYVRTDRRSVPCGNSGYAGVPSSPTRTVPRCNRNNTIFNGLLGGSIAAAFSKPDAYKWSVPLGVALGVSASRVDCQ